MLILHSYLDNVQEAKLKVELAVQLQNETVLMAGRNTHTFRGLVMMPGDREP